jgi:hypothetical protein
MKGPLKTLSYRVGHKRGLQGLPYSCPWWADSTVFMLAYTEGRKIYLQHQSSLKSFQALRDSDDDSNGYE